MNENSILQTTAVREQHYPLAGSFYRNLSIFQWRTQGGGGV